MRQVEGKKAAKPCYLDFKADHYNWKPGIDYRADPEAYRVGKGEQGVLICEPYKKEIGLHWRFKTEAIAKESSTIIYDLFLKYLDKDEFVGADLARKYLQMGFTRARRYANYKGGKKYDKEKEYQILQRGTGEDEKAKAADVFYQKWQQAENNAAYKAQKIKWKQQKG